MSPEPSPIQSSARPVCLAEVHTYALPRLSIYAMSVRRSETLSQSTHCIDIHRDLVRELSPPSTLPDTEPPVPPGGTHTAY